MNNIADRVKIHHKLPEMISPREFVYETDLIQRNNRIHDEPYYFVWIDTSWILMLIQKELIPERHVPKIIRCVQDIWNDPALLDTFTKPYPGIEKYFGAIERYVIQQHGEEVGGSLTLGRTQPPLMQIFPVRHKLLNVMCCISDFMDALIDTAEKHVDAVMPGYTHFRQAQPTTFGHYLMSIFDPLKRIYETLEDSYHSINLNELGCGALAGVSWDIDRNTVSDYLGLDGIIENANDAVGFTDGYVMVTASLTNYMTVISRLTLELNIWSGSEYGFMHVPHLGEMKSGTKGSHSHFMPNKTDNAPNLERPRAGAAELLGQLVESVSMGMRMPHGDMHEMLHMKDATLRAIDSVFIYLHVLTFTLPRITVNKDNMLKMAKQGYSCSTELANQLMRDHDMSFRVAHHIVNEFVKASEAQYIPSSEARTEMLDQASEKVIGKSLHMDQARLQKLLDPLYFVEITGSQGGVSSSEVLRMIADRRTWLDGVWTRLDKEVSTLEESKKRVEQDLMSLVQVYA